MLKRVLMSVAMLSLLLSFNAFGDTESAFAEENTFTVEVIPPQMKPWTVIEYLDDSTYTVLSGGALDPELLNSDGLTVEAQTDADLNRQMADIQGEVVEIPNPEPSAGMRVIYDGEGFIRSFEGGTYRYSSLPRGTTSPEGTYHWGDHNNTLVVTGSSVTGTGRLTTFVDKKGEDDNKLGKGDVATKGEMDNPSHGKKLDVTAPRKNGGSATYQMTKADNGSLPDAVLDIWKTGVEKWGYKWNSSLSINNGSYTYYR